MRAYQACLEGASTTTSVIGASRSKPGTVSAAIVGYISSPSFRSLSKNTQSDRAGVLEKFRQEHGDKGVATLQRHHVERMLAKKPTPATALHLFTALKELMGYAVRIGLRKDDPTQGVKRPKYDARSGLYAWTEADIEKFEARHPVGTRERLAMALGLFTGQRRSDVMRMGWQHVRQGTITVRQQKTGTELTLPLHPTLMSILNSTPRTQLTFLVSSLDLPFSKPGFSNFFRKACRAAGLPEKATFHGLRKAAARRLAEAGCSASLIASITGHRSLKEVEFYTRSADLVGIRSGTRRRRPCPHFGTPGGTCSMG
jgi:integrase